MWSGEFLATIKDIVERAPVRRWHLSVLPTLLRSYPTGQARREEKRSHVYAVLRYMEVFNRDKEYG
jgi:hypothetical protein